MNPITPSLLADAQRIAVVRALQLGDMLCAVPALRALRAAAPDAEIVVVGLPWAKGFVARFHRYLDRFIELPGYPGLVETAPDIRRIPAFLVEAQAFDFDLAIQMHGNGGITNPLTALLGARRNAGYFAPGSFCPDPATFMPYPEKMHEIHRHLSLARFLGAASDDDAMEFPLTAADWHDLRMTDGTHLLRPNRYAVIHGGARATERRWSPRQFAHVADSLAARGLQIVLTGSAEEALTTQGIAAAMTAPALNLTGKTSLGALGALLSGARIVVCNDTGVAHVATALRVSSVVIFSASDPARWSPLDTERHRVVHAASPTAVEEAVKEADSLLAVEEVSRFDLTPMGGNAYVA